MDSTDTSATVYMPDMGVSTVTCGDTSHAEGSYTITLCLDTGGQVEPRSPANPKCEIIKVAPTECGARIVSSVVETALGEEFELPELLDDDEIVP